MMLQGSKNPPARLPGLVKIFIWLVIELSTFLAQRASKPIKSPVVYLTGKICIEIFRKDVSHEINYRKSQY